MKQKEGFEKLGVHNWMNIWQHSALKTNVKNYISPKEHLEHQSLVAHEQETDY